MCENCGSIRVTDIGADIWWCEDCGHKQPGQYTDDRWDDEDARDVQIERVRWRDINELGYIRPEHMPEKE